jgi:uncharacterized membrane protein
VSTLARRTRDNLSGIVLVLVTGIWLAALLLGFDWWLPFMLFGYIALVPITSMLFDEEEEAEQPTPETPTSERADGQQTEQSATIEEPTEAALETLRSRYARGELTDAQFERKLERLLETETVEGAAERVRRGQRHDSAATNLDELDLDSTDPAEPAPEETDLEASDVETETER